MTVHNAPHIVSAECIWQQCGDGDRGMPIAGAAVRALCEARLHTSIKITRWPHARAYARRPLPRQSTDGISTSDTLRYLWSASTCEHRRTKTEITTHSFPLVRFVMLYHHHRGIFRLRPKIPYPIA